MKVSIVPAEHGHIAAIAACVRRSDRLELYLAACEAPAATLRRALAASPLSWTGMIDGEPVCMFGVAPGVPLTGTGHPWMVGTDELDRHPFTFLRRCKARVAEMQAAYSTLENYVHQGNTKAIEWLMWLGFKVEIPGQSMGPFGAQFCHFTMRRNG